MQEDIELEEIKKDARKKFLREAGVRSITTGFGDNYLSAFAVALGAGEFFISLLTSIPTLFASIFQISSPYIMKKTGLRKKLITNGVLLHAFSWFCILFIIFIDPTIGLWALLILIILQLSVEWFINAPWMSWLGEYIDPKTRGEFVGNKRAISLFFSLASLISAGLILGFFESYWHLYGFLIIFSVAFLARLYTYINLNSIPPTSYDATKTKVISPFKFLKEKRKKEMHSFINFLSFFRFAVMIASPFFTLYMLRDLNFSYIQYMILISITVFVQVISMRYWGKITDKFGNKVVLSCSSILISFIPLLWLLSTNFNYLITIRIFDGFIWGAFNLSAYNYLLATSSIKDRSAYVANYNLFTGIATFLGAMIGGLIAFYSLNHSLFLVGIPLVFLISGVLRLLVTLILGTKLKERLIKKQKGGRHMLVKLMVVYPLEGMRQTIIQGWGYRKSKE